jgi:UDP-N-acetylglucosamine--N-acetylmuramyl-(pentapeptide) pyrophosphoryl-undecaprenol N-acetylglucosamine transferase
MKKILLTGGGTAGHVTPNIALIPGLAAAGYEIHYAGSVDGIERRLIEPLGIAYHAVSSGKLRRYFSLKNFTDIFRVIKGLSDAIRLVRRIKPDICFSKGGFVAVPIVIACKLNKIPVIIHESDMTPGLATKITGRFADKICVTFPETLTMVPDKKGIHTGTPIRSELFKGERGIGAKFCGFTDYKPTVLVMGGSLGSVKINNTSRGILLSVTEIFNVIHLCGKGNLDDTFNYANYKQYEYISDELPHIFALADIIISRAGSNSINEFLALRKPSLLIPLSAKASRGDQIINAESFKAHGYANVLREEDMTPETLLREIKNLFNVRGVHIAEMRKNKTANDGVKNILNLITNYPPPPSAP